MQTPMVIDVSDLQVRYKDVVAVNGLSLQVRAGEIFGLLGPNGAGKSSTLHCIEGLRKPDGGSVRVAGHDVVRESGMVKRMLGVQLQASALFAELRVVELIELYAALYEVFPTRQAIQTLLERFGLAQKARAKARQLSGGQQQRLALALAVVNDPRVVLLDEPSTGLDPQARRGVWTLVKRMRAEGRTVLLTTHSMEEAQELCDRVGIVDGGKLIALDTPVGLIERYAPALPSAGAASRQPNLEDVFLALTGHGLSPAADQEVPEDIAWQPHPAV